MTEVIHFREVEDYYFFEFSEEVMVCVPHLKILVIEADEPYGRPSTESLEMGTLFLEYLHMEVDTCWGMDLRQVKLLVVIPDETGGNIYPYHTLLDSIRRPDIEIRDDFEIHPFWG